MRCSAASRVRYEPADRVWFAALAWLVPRSCWTQVFPVTPATLLFWHRKLAAKKYDTSKQRKPGRPRWMPRTPLSRAAMAMVPAAGNYRTSSAGPCWDVRPYRAGGTTP